MELEPATLDFQTQELLREVLDEVRREAAGRFDETIIISPATVDQTIATALSRAAEAGVRDRSLLKRYAQYVCRRYIDNRRR
jgi:hypothetical protein